MTIYRLENVVQNYAWGSTTAIANLLGQPSPSPTPQAELWMGTHPKGPSMVIIGQKRIPLSELIHRQTDDIIGRDIATRYGNTLPFLFKVLAAARPLSIQAHPDKDQAVTGFERENRAGIALDAPDRNYRDTNHKPEIICALTPFWGLNGFRAAASAAELLLPVCPPILVDACNDLKLHPAFGLQRFFEAMMAVTDTNKRGAVEAVRMKAKRLVDRSAVYGWMDKLAHAYPNDMGVLSPALLNLIRLEPGQAMYLPAGQLHGYLDGVGIELMANSDNVLRGGLTAKHVDVAELLRVVRFQETRVDIIEPESVDTCESAYACPAAAFILSVIRTTNNLKYRSSESRNVEILLCTEGEGLIKETDDNTGLSVNKGDSFLVPASIESYSVQGNLVLYKAAVPRSPQ